MGGCGDGGSGGGGGGGDGVAVMVIALGRIRSRAPSCPVLLFVLHSPVYFFSFLSSFQALASFVPHTSLCDFLAIFLLAWICFHFFL